MFSMSNMGSCDCFNSIKIVSMSLRRCMSHSETSAVRLEMEIFACSEVLDFGKVLDCFPQRREAVAELSHNLG